MQDSLRTAVAGAVGAVVATTVLTATPALADRVDKATKKVTSAQIKNGTIKVKDLGPEVTGSLAKADTALQGIPDNSVGLNKIVNGSVTGPKLAANSVTGDKMADNAIGAAELQDGSVGAAELVDGGVGSAELADGTVAGADLASNAVSGTKVQDESLRLADLAVSSGSEPINFPNIASGQCATSGTIATGEDLNDAIILLEQPASVSGSLNVFARQAQPGFTSFVVVACAVAGGFDPPEATFTWAVLR